MRSSLKFGITIILSSCLACKVPTYTVRQESKMTPSSFAVEADTTNAASIKWSVFFRDSLLVALIDSALTNNQELAILAQDIEIDKNEIRVKKGDYLPFVNFIGASGVDKSGKYTWNGLAEEDLKANPNKAPRYVGDQLLGAMASWEIDIWKKLRNARKAAVARYLYTIEGRNAAKTVLVAEIANSYYELLALDNFLAVINQNIVLQRNALELIRFEKEAAKVTQLAVNRFEAQLLNTENLQFEVKQQIIETENRINFLVGRFPQTVTRSQLPIGNLAIGIPQAGFPSQLLSNRADIRHAELALAASKLDVQVAKASFFPSIRLTAGVGLNAFNAGYLIQPASILYKMAGDIVAPLVNRNAIKAAYSTANLRQTSAAINYEKTVLNGFIEVSNDLSRIENYKNSFIIKEKEVGYLTQSIAVLNSLFSSARADYIEVLLTQREALNSKIELIELKLKQLKASVSLYRSLGGGWN